ncbi:hypothetical protein REPUB_Repub08aG0202300 [Reevesia pubescens]
MEEDHKGDKDYIRYFLVNKREIWMKELSERYRPDDDLQLQDRISGMPDLVRHHILSFMPMQTSIRTSMLSGEWRHLWKDTRIVDFHTLPVYSINRVRYTRISRSLDLLRSPHIDSFTVVGHVGPRSHPQITKWVDLALSHNVHTLRIGLMFFPAFPTRFFKLPRSLFIKNDQTLKLKLLFLSCVDYTPPPGVNFSASGFASLDRLSFTACKLADTTLDLFLLKCVGLKVLVLDRCLGLANVNIRGSNLMLKHLVFKWCDYNDGVFRLLEFDVPGLITLLYSGDLTKIRLNNCQGLQKLTLLGTQEQINEANIHHIRELVNQVTYVKDLRVNFELLQFVAKEYYTRGNPFLEFQNLEHLRFWADHSLGSQNDVYNLVAFLGDCPSLESCVIDFRNECWTAFCDTISETYEKPEFVEVEGAQEHQVYHGNRLEKVKSIRVICFSGFDGEMMLLRLLLEKAVKLQKLELFWRIPASEMGGNVLQIIRIREEGAPDLVANLEEEKDAIKEEVHNFPKASENAEVHFYSLWESGCW